MNDAAAPLPPSPPPAPAPTPQQQAAARMRQFLLSLRPYTPRIYVTYGLLAACIGIWVAQVALGVHAISPRTDALLRWGANQGLLTRDGQWWRLVTCTFLHAGVVHLVMNMLVLWSIGGFMERLLGNVGFLVVYLFAGISGSFASMSVAPSVISVGASGALFGLYGALAGFLLRAHGTLPKDVLKQLWRMAGFFVFYNVLYGLNKAGIDQGAHFGGLVGGFVGGLVLGHPLAPAEFARRRVRALALAAVGVVALPLLARYAPQAPDVFVAIHQLDVVEVRLDAKVRDALAKNRKGELSDRGVADVVEREFLPEWRSQLERIRALRGLHGRQAQIRDRVVAFMTVRADAYQLLVDGARTGDRSLVDAYGKKMHESNMLAEKLYAP